ncbi:alpha/beta hydrolase [Streptomyces sp. NPDC101160]|uniref:alpha/beta hydrolase n=1 Tax=Streptomyces sp. NPDC101160 TaxID=3366118 RepID=UPI0037FE0218
MLTWQQLRDLKLSDLEDAADGWGEASNLAGAGRDRVSNGMTNALAASQKGEAAKAALGRLVRLDRNLDYVHTECGLVRTTLNSLAYELSGPQRQVKDALEDAAGLKFTVHEDGTVSYPPGGENLGDQQPLPGGTATGSSYGTPYGPPLHLGPPQPGLAPANPNHAKAQDIANRILRAVNDAREIDGRFSETLAKLKAPPGLTVDTKTWTDAAADAAAVRGVADDYLKNDIPLDKSPAERKAWWTYLTQEQREEYLAVYPNYIGNLDGIPADVRDAANRDNLQLLIGKLSGADTEKARTQLAGLQEIDRQLRETPKPGVPPMYLLGIGEHGNGRAIVSFGNPDTSRNVSAYVPGLGTALDKEFATNDIQRARDTAKGAMRYDRSTAAIVWLGYDAPQLPAERVLDNAAVMFEHDGKVGAVAYDQFMAGISATNQHEDPHVTAIGHSYGSFTVGQAAQREGGIPGADDIVLLGSPGTGADSAAELGVGKDHVFVGAADNDPVTRLPAKGEAAAGLAGSGVGGVAGGLAGGMFGQPFGRGPAGVVVGGFLGAAGGAYGGYSAANDESQLWFGTDPAHEEFGARRFKTADGPLPLVGGEGPIDAHSNYFNPLPGKDPVSANNIALIVSGHSNDITTEEPR